jgi:hypothetical protein
MILFHIVLAKEKEVEERRKNGRREEGRERGRK